MGVVLEVYCVGRDRTTREPTHDERPSKVARVERLFEGTPSEHWSAMVLDRQDGTIARAADKATRDGNRIAEAEMYDELVGSESARAYCVTFDFTCDHPHCEFNWQRREHAARSVLNALADAGESQVSLHALAALVR